jgi:cytidine deaminase
MAEKLEFKLEFEVFQQEELNAQDLGLLKKAREATNTSYAPYSGFNVGAALLLEDGTIISGSNQENAAYPSGMCAERTALFFAGANYMGKKILSIAIAARHSDSSLYMNVAPCGSCRQAMLEYENLQNLPVRILMQNADNKIFISPSVENILPIKFTSINLQR